MGKKKFGRLIIDPAVNTAVLDTETWDIKGALNVLHSVDWSFWEKLTDSFSSHRIATNEHIELYPASVCRYRGRGYLLAKLEDGQRVFLETGEPSGILGKPILVLSNNKITFSVYETDASRIDVYCHNINQEKGPKCMRDVPRLGVGSRMTRSLWPGVWEAMVEFGFSANAIQNSLRELNLLDELLGGAPAKTNYLFGFGNIEEGHTGSTFEGLWTTGVLEAIAADGFPRYGTDADHIQVKRGPGGKDRAMKVINAARYYTFYTLDISDILNYGAFNNVSGSEAAEFLTKEIPNEEERQGVCLFHRRKRCFGGYSYQLDYADIGRLVGKYWKAINVAEELFHHISSVKKGRPFDFELSIDENPPEVKTFDSLTTDCELLFLILETKRRNITLTHVAPNLGVEKGVDYRGADGLEGLFNRMRRLCNIAGEYGLMIDCHSGDYLGEQTRKVIGKATKGRNHFKISPSLQLIYAQVLSEVHPEVFNFWWDDTLEYARREAANGSEFAAECIKEYELAGNLLPSANHNVFKHFSFATIGRRDVRGQLINRERFYGLSASFQSEYRKRVKEYLCHLANDLFNC